jgi:CNT family concentrative nucleoside transporter
MENHLYPRCISAFGVVVMLALSWLCSENHRRALPWRIILWGVGLQIALALAIIRSGADHLGVQAAFDVITRAASEGSNFVFGSLTKPEYGAIIGFQVLPVVIFVSALSSVLYYLGVIQWLVSGFAFVMRWTMKTSGAETFGVAIQVFTGIESLPALRGYLKTMTRSELSAIMTSFMATTASSVMVAYASFGAKPWHLLAASIISAPASIVVSKIMVPETGTPETQKGGRIVLPQDSHNIVDAAARGASDGLNLALNIGAVLIAFVGLVYLINQGSLALVGHTFKEIMGWLFRPIALAMGISWQDSAAVGQLLGAKTVLNEILAYQDMKGMVQANLISPRSVTIATYALCGFANPGSLAILIAGMTSLIPDRRQEVVQLGLKAFIGGALASFMTACIAGALVYE